MRVLQVLVEHIEYLGCHRGLQHQGPQANKPLADKSLDQNACRGGARNGGAASRSNGPYITHIRPRRQLPLPSLGISTKPKKWTCSARSPKPRTARRSPSRGLRGQPCKAACQLCTPFALTASACYSAALKNKHAGHKHVRRHHALQQLPCRRHSAAETRAPWGRLWPPRCGGGALQSPPSVLAAFPSSARILPLAAGAGVEAAKAPRAPSATIALHAPRRELAVGDARQRARASPGQARSAMRCML